MKGRLYSFACSLYCGVLVCWRHVLAHEVHAAGGIKVNESASSAPFFSLRRALLPTTHYRPTREQQGQRQPVSEWHPQQDAGSAARTECVPPSSCDYSPSFVQKRVNAEVDVSCFPHEGNIGSRTYTYDRRVTNTVAQCLARCRSDGKCSHFTWNKKSHSCHLKSDPPDFYTYPGDVTGPRSCDTTCLVGCLTYNTTPIKTLDWGNKVASLCQAACWSTASCRAFVLDEGKCKLFGSGFSAYRAVSGGKTIAGPKNLCENPSDLRLAELLDGHRPGSCLKRDNIGSRTPEIHGTAKADSIIDCQKRCRNNNQCNHYTYNINSKMCFMKKGMPPAYYMMEGDITGDKMCRPY